MRTKINYQYKLLLLFFLVTTLANGQESWEFGNKYKAYIKAPREPLRVKMVNNASLNSHGFVTRVGGVAFLAVAEPDNSVEGKSIRLDYIPTNVDGRRLQVIIDNDTINPYLPDWQLIPIINFSNSEYNSCVSLFGPQSNENEFDIVYHSAFTNTLLGVRLLQADMVLMDMITHHDLPKYNNKVILGKGEINPSGLGWQNAVMQIQEFFQLARYQSWVLTDDNVKFRFSIREGMLSFSGFPYYYFWITDPLDLERRRNMIAKSQALVEEYNNNVELYNRTNNVKIGNYLDKLNLKIQELEKELTETEPKILPVDEITSKLKSKYKLLQELNPPVYNAALNVSHYSAFFRYVREKNPLMWNKFYSNVHFVRIYPSVKTPTTFPKKLYNE